VSTRKLHLSHNVPVGNMLEAAPHHTCLQHVRRPTQNVRPNLFTSFHKFHPTFHIQPYHQLLCKFTHLRRKLSHSQVVLRHVLFLQGKHLNYVFSQQLQKVHFMPLGLGPKLKIVTGRILLSYRQNFGSNVKVALKLHIFPTVVECRF
jgi:hypothetical protein